MILIWFTVAKIWGEFKHEVRQFQKPYDNQQAEGNDSNLLIVFYVQIVPDDFVMQLHRF